VLPRASVLRLCQAVLDHCHHWLGLKSFQALEPDHVVAIVLPAVVWQPQTILRLTAGNWSEKDRIPIKIPPCDTCGVENTYAGTRAFLQFFYTGELIIECVLASAALLSRHGSHLIPLQCELHLPGFMLLVSVIMSSEC